VKIATTVSIEISIGRDTTGAACKEESDNEAAVTDWSAACSWAE
jgi:hypothetical protein